MTADDWDVIGEGANVDLFNWLGLRAPPLGFWWQWLANVWPAAAFEAEFSGGRMLDRGSLRRTFQHRHRLSLLTRVITCRRRLSQSEYELRPLNQQRRTSSTASGQPQGPDL
jgi:hypothetical protein